MCVHRVNGTDSDPATLQISVLRGTDGVHKRTVTVTFVRVRAKVFHPGGVWSSFLIFKINI